MVATRASSSASPQQAAAAAHVSNSQLRAALLTTGVRYKKNLGSFTGTLGQSTRIKLFNVGIITSLRLYVSVSLTIGTLAAVPSQKSPWNLINKIRLTDYDGTDRIQLSGWQLFLLNSIRAAQAWGYNSDNVVYPGGVITNPAIPTATGTATLSFFLDFPIALDDNRMHGLRQDLTGAIFAQTGVGDLYLTIDWNPNIYANGNVEAVYAGAATTTVTASNLAVQVWQRYILPQPVGQRGTIPLPANDLLSVYEINGNLRVTTNIAVGVEALLNFPNVRKVIGTYVSFVNGTANTALGTTDLTNLRTLVNGNNTMEEFSQPDIIIRQRLENHGDIAIGTYWWLYRDRPIETAVFGNVQLGLTPNAVNAGAYFEVLFESIYRKGASLPGLVQGS